MPDLGSTAVTIGYAFVGAAAIVVLFALLAGGVNTRGLLAVKSPAGPRDEVSPARVQLLLATIAIALNYLVLVVDSLGTHTLPEVPTLWLEVLGGSQGVYLLSKFPKFVSIPDALRRVIGKEPR